MTFPEAQAIASDYQFLIGQKTITGQTIVSIIISKAKEKYQAFAFYYTAGSQVGNDPLEWYAERQPRRLQIGKQMFSYC